MTTRRHSPSARSRSRSREAPSGGHPIARAQRASGCRFGTRCLRVAWLGAAVAALSCRGGGAAGSGSSAARATCAVKVLQAARATTRPTIDGKLSEPDWRRASSSKAFVDAQHPTATVPHTEVRLLWDARALYVGFYAADQDIRDADWVAASFRARQGAEPLRWTLAPTSRLQCSARVAQSCARARGVLAADDTDGTLNNASDEDEEWTAEMVLPWSSLGMGAAPSATERLRLNFFRRDQPKGAPARQLVWSPPCDGVEEGMVEVMPPRARSGAPSF
jgi:hypothetical protein